MRCVRWQAAHEHHDLEGVARLRDLTSAVPLQQGAALHRPVAVEKERFLEEVPRDCE